MISQESLHERHPLAARVLSTIGMQQEGLVRKRGFHDGISA
jgi:hypothetical protein